MPNLSRDLHRVSTESSNFLTSRGKKKPMLCRFNRTLRLALLGRKIDSEEINQMSTNQIENENN